MPFGLVSKQLLAANANKNKYFAKSLIAGNFDTEKQPIHHTDDFYKRLSKKLISIYKENKQDGDTVSSFIEENTDSKLIVEFEYIDYKKLYVKILSSKDYNNIHINKYKMLT